MNLFLTLVTAVMITILATHSNETPNYILIPLIIITFVPAFVAFIKSELRDTELEARIKRLEKAEKENEK